ncbi:MAG: hypothetical protein HYX60_07555 [Legionella longbeachae]|nr:hypothetical protein [Legionella longbeachae]
MKFQLGTSGNPSGRPKGAVNKQTHYSNLLESHAEQLINKVVELALDGDSIALRLCIERLLPKAKQKGIELDQTIINQQGVGSHNEVISLILNEVLAGNIIPDEGKKIISLIEDHQLRIQFS